MSICSKPLPRLPDWEDRLNAFLTANHDREDVGQFECAFFAAGAVEAQTGVDLAKGFNRALHTDGDVAAELKAHGAANLAALVETLLPRRVRSMARRGDIVLTRDGNLAVAWGEHALALGIPDAPGREPMLGNGNIVRVPRALWRKAWAVG